MNVAIVGTYPEGTFSRFQAVLSGCADVTLKEIRTQEQFDHLEDADAIVLRILKMPAKTVARFPSLKLIIRWGAGFDSVDIQEAGRRGIAVCNTPGANASSVAELAVLLMLAIGRRLICHDRCLHRGSWSKNIFLDQTFTLNHKLVGIIGGGNIGRQVAARVQAFGAQAQYYDPFRLPTETENALGMRYASLEELLVTSDVVTLHVPLTDSTMHMIGAEQIASMKNGAILVNTARGGLIDDDAVIAAVNSGKLAGAGIDCVEHEPVLPGSPILENPNIIVTPHVGGGTADLADAIIPMITENLLALYGKKPLKYVVNAELLQPSQMSST